MTKYIVLSMEFVIGLILFILIVKLVQYLTQSGSEPTLEEVKEVVKESKEILKLSEEIEKIDEAKIKKTKTKVNKLKRTK